MFWNELFELFSFCSFSFSSITLPSQIIIKWWSRLNSLLQRNQIKLNNLEERKNLCYQKQKSTRMIIHQTNNMIQIALIRGISEIDFPIHPSEHAFPLTTFICEIAIISSFTVSACFITMKCLLLQSCINWWQRNIFMTML